MSTELPAWATALRNRYLAGEASLFLLHGNVRDLQPWTHEDGTIEWMDLKRFLHVFLTRTRDVVVNYNVSQGMTFGGKGQQRLFKSIIDAQRMLRGEARIGVLPRSSTEVIPVVEDLLSDPTHSSAVIMDYFEMIAPNADVAYMTHEDKANLVSLQRWSTDPAMLATDNLAILVTEHVSDVNRRILASPQLSAITIEFPDAATRHRYLLSDELPKTELEMDTQHLANITAGLSLLQIRGLLRGAELSGEAVTFRRVNARKKTIIEQQCQGLVEFVTPEHSFDHVGGMARIKADLHRVADSVKAGRSNHVPMGMIFVGPMGTGKTFVAEAFAAESGLTCLKLGNIRGGLVGDTERNLEQVLDLVDALGYVLLIIDEADRELSSASGEGGVTSRVIARLKQFMSDTSHRGKVVIMMMTNRPDKLDVDLKRPGRFDLKIPFFFPEEDSERKLIFEALMRKNKIPTADDLDLTSAVTNTADYSGAEIEAILLTASRLASEAESDLVLQDHLDQAVEDVIPSRDTRMLEYMEMLAVFESSAKRMLPKRYKDLTTEQVQGRLDELQMILGRRAM
jgi:AAA+ superfamily predicted ATPase